MAHDGPGRRSIEVTHRNLPRLHFRAYRVELRRHLARSRDCHLLPGQRQISALLARRNPAAEWTVELPATPDFRDHRTFVTPPLYRPGLYVVVASGRRGFRQARNRSIRRRSLATGWTGCCTSIPRPSGSRRSP